MKCKEYIMDNIDKIGFANETIVEMPKLKFHDYVYKKNVLVDLNQIIGSDHSDYAGKTWLEALNHLKRPANLYGLHCDSKEPNISYYVSHNKLVYTTNNWTFYIVNNEFGYIVEGNHRTIIAKFLAALDLIPNKILIPNVTYITCEIDSLDDEKRKQNKLSGLFNWLN